MIVCSESADVEILIGYICVCFFDDFVHVIICKENHVRQRMCFLKNKGRQVAIFFSPGKPVMWCKDKG